ncbi:phage tail sheath subtilisin-like domain-containing protein [Tessaracoccus sp. MC1627]|uniref:phage tail sheath family protein n=1 Tax=Tessaracoccus sp. MC1627 TaxID=2760312 RepID=UPI0016044FA5|nr:phage tail sheath subtilisin-like domain-containing protein [Tessaracoccus sp. MC1627]MBB1511313.1 phage tail sheath subtilisin-like domain-containing protein [Tessaracoccus sp. MC1627]
MPYIEEIPSGTAIQPLPTSVTGFVGACSQGPVETPVTVTSPGEYHATFGPSLGADQPLGHAVDLFFANGGTSAIVVRAAGPAPEQLVPVDGASGLNALEDSGVTVLAIPGLTAAHHQHVTAALTFCAAHRSVLLLDLPAGPFDAVARATVQQTGPYRERAAAYHPWLVVGGVQVPPSGAVAGAISRSDAERGVWKAPANIALHGIDGFTEALGEEAGELLTQEGVNALREFPGRGRLVWGARTLAGAQSIEPPKRYLSVRRLTDHVLASIAAGLGFVVFEPNDVPLWVQVRTTVENFLFDLWRQGALQGTKPEHAYGARCGLGQTMTQADVEAGRLILEVFIATVRPAEFDVHRLTLQTQAPGEPADGDTQPFGLVGRRRIDAQTVRTVDLSRVVSRYIGETEKNLAEVFDAAERAGQVLLFDEADALFGGRSDVRDSHDRYANQEVSYLIEKLARERHVEVRWRRPRPPA